MPNQRNCKSWPVTRFHFSNLPLQVPRVEFESEIVERPTDDEQKSPTSPTPRQSRLTRFLNDLSLRANDPPYDTNDNKHSGNINGVSAMMSSSNSAIYLSSNLNPEADSLTYMETLLESLTVLGKLGNSLDNIAQRVPGEIFTLVETTLAEVEERAEFGRRRSMFELNANMGRTEGAYVFNTSLTLPTMATTRTNGPPFKSSTLRLTALESLAKRLDHEILMDLFWTLYSKLDAVAQGFRVVTEVVNRIGSVGFTPRHYYNLFIFLLEARL